MLIDEKDFLSILRPFLNTLSLSSVVEVFVRVRY